MLGKSISKNSLILGIFAIVTASILATTEGVTREKIAAAERKAAQKALSEIIPPEMHDNDLLSDTMQLTDNDRHVLNLTENEAIHLAKYKGQLKAIIVPSIAPDGYSGKIKLIIGIMIDGSIAGVRALSHKETPGLGDKIDLNKNDWILSFNDKSLTNPIVENWKVKKDGGEFDQFTGATITPRAVVNQVKKTLELFSESKLSSIDENTQKPM